jgi:hypothetical protein
MHDDDPFLSHPDLAKLDARDFGTFASTADWMARIRAGWGDDTAGADEAAARILADYDSGDRNRARRQIHGRELRRLRRQMDTDR